MIHRAVWLSSGRWGHPNLPISRLTDHAMFIANTAHWLLGGPRQECDDILLPGDPGRDGTWFIWAR